MILHPLFHSVNH